MKPVTLKSKFGQVFGWALWAILAVSTLMIGVSEGVWPMVQTGTVAAFMGLLLHLMLIRPRILVSDDGVEVVNPLRKTDVAWASIERIDTKWGLTLYAGDRKIQAWSAPAPGRHSSLRSTKFEGRHLPESSYLAGTIRPGDLVSSDSGAAAYTIRNEWERRRDLGLLTDRHAVTDSWHRIGLVALGALLTAAILTNLG